jgi:hypothetical protein
MNSHALKTTPKGEALFVMLLAILRSSALRLLLCPFQVQEGSSIGATCHHLSALQIPFTRQPL